MPMNTLLIVLGIYVIGWGIAFLYVQRHAYPHYCAKSGEVVESRIHQLHAAAWWPIMAPITVVSRLLRWRQRSAKKSV